jgi:hypothetical protein
VRAHTKVSARRHTLPQRGRQTRPKPFHSRSRPPWTVLREKVTALFLLRLLLTGKCCADADVDTHCTKTKLFLLVLSKYPFSPAAEAAAVLSPFVKTAETDPGANSYAVVRLIVSWS